MARIRKSHDVFRQNVGCPTCPGVLMVLEVASRRLADQAGVLESQRQIYIERFRRLEAQVRLQVEEIAELRARLSDAASVEAQ